MLHTRKAQNWVTVNFIMGVQILLPKKQHFTVKCQTFHETTQNGRVCGSTLFTPAEVAGELFD